MKKQATADNVVVMIFDFHLVQADMQYESLSVLKLIVEKFSDLGQIA